VLTASTSSAQSSECITTGIDSHTFVFDSTATDAVRAGDEIRAFNPTGDCIGAATWTGANLALPVIGGTSPDPVYAVTGDTLVFRVYDGTNLKQTTNYAYEATPIGPPRATFAPNYVTRVTSFDVVPPSVDSTVIAVGFPVAEAIARSDRWRVTLAISAPDGDTTTAYQVALSGADSIHTSASYTTTSTAQDGTLHAQVLGSSIYGGDLPTGVQVSGAFDDGVRTDTLRLAYFDGVVNDGSVPAATQYGTREIVLRRALTADVNADGTVDFADVSAILGQIVFPPYTVPASDFPRGDIDGDGSVSFLDAALVFFRLTDGTAAGSRN
jgi:hypothetical protein